MIFTWAYTWATADLDGVNLGKREESEDERNSTQSQMEYELEGNGSKLREL